VRYFQATCNFSTFGSVNLVQWAESRPPGHWPKWSQSPRADASSTATGAPDAIVLVVPCLKDRIDGWCRGGMKQCADADGDNDRQHCSGRTVTGRKTCPATKRRASRPRFSHGVRSHRPITNRCPRVLGHQRPSVEAHLPQRPDDGPEAACPPYTSGAQPASAPTCKTLLSTNASPATR